MSTELIAAPAPQPLATVQPGAAAQAYAAQSRSANTRRAYRADWAHWCAWCDERGATPLPAAPALVADYIAALAGTYTVSTIQRRLASISQAHQLADHDSPCRSETVRSVMKGIRRALGSAPRQAAPAVTTLVRQMVKALPATRAGQRDAALLLLGFAGAFRRSELVALDYADLRFVPEGVVVTLRRSKTDQEGEGTRKGIPLGEDAASCPVRALRAWLTQSGISSGALFRPVDRHGHLSDKRLSGNAVSAIVKRSAHAAGLDPQQYSGHSLRAGFATAAAAAGAADRAIKRQTGHKSDRVLARYIREGSLFRDNAAATVGL